MNRPGHVSRRRTSRKSSKGELRGPSADGASSLEPYRGEWVDVATKEDVVHILENVPCGIFVVERPLGKSLYINPEVLKISGYDLADIPTARVARKALFPDKKTQRQQARYHEEMMAGATENPFLSRIVRKDGSTITCEVRCVELGDGIMVGVWTDVTRREVAEEELRIREARFRSLFEDSFDAVLLLDNDAIINCNQAALTMFCYSRRNDLLGTKLNDLFLNDNSLRATETGHHQTMPVPTRRKKARFENTLRRANGETFPAEITAIRIRLQDKDILHVMIRDVTTLKEAQKALMTTKERLEERVRERTTELTRVNRELKESREELRLLSEHLQRAREDERTVISREVHDELGQLLTALKMDVAYSEQHLEGDPAALRDRMTAMESQIDSGIKTVRKICSDLRPHVLERLGLSAGIEWFVNAFAKRTGINCRVDIAEGLPDPGKDLSLVIFRVLQEAMTNVARHAEATKVKIDLLRRAKLLVLTISDNGKGITQDDVENPESFGILGMRERIRFWGGRSEFKGSVKGTRITIHLPLSVTGPDNSPQRPNRRTQKDEGRS
jgi:PAS domain S-box-containing protein